MMFSGRVHAASVCPSLREHLRCSGLPGLLLLFVLIHHLTSSSYLSCATSPTHACTQAVCSEVCSDRRRFGGLGWPSAARGQPLVKPSTPSLQQGAIWHSSSWDYERFRTSCPVLRLLSLCKAASLCSLCTLCHQES